MTALKPNMDLFTVACTVTMFLLLISSNETAATTRNRSSTTCCGRRFYTRLRSVCPRLVVVGKRSIFEDSEVNHLKIIRKRTLASPMLAEICCRRECNRQTLKRCCRHLTVK
ncbi:unnamed protein product [Owenia fusiformis]|uniref:Uncharacterized protein n=1 Tax=Owenia fusiformis TaxID=6347 RepID=A0A8J1U8A2_OWEFU|nr:unnamed protein product [Owenia fusiformis]